MEKGSELLLIQTLRKILRRLGIRVLGRLDGQGILAMGGEGTYPCCDLDLCTQKKLQEKYYGSPLFFA